MADTRRREAIIVSWLEEISADARAVFLVGDVFDFWFEYKWTVPKGYVRLLGTLAQMCDQGIEIHFLKGNHDMWVYEYFQEEIGMIVHDSSYEFEDGEKHFFLDHGDGLGKGERKYKMVRSTLRNRFLQQSYARLHEVHDLPIRFAEEHLLSNETDFFIMGHRHQPIDKLLSNQKSRYINLGDWVTQNTYAKWDGQDLKLESFKG